MRLNTIDGLEALQEMLRSCHTFSLASDASSNIHGTACFSLRVLISPTHAGEGVSNLHVVAFPLYEKPSGEHTVNLTEKVFDFLDVTWKTKVVRVASDGARNMTGIFKIWQYRIHAASHDECDSDFYPIWFANHQIDLVDKASIAATNIASTIEEHPD